MIAGQSTYIRKAWGQTAFSLMALAVILFLSFARAQHASPVGPAKGKLASIEGIVFAPFYSGQGLSSNQEDVRVGDAGRVVLQLQNQPMSIEVGLSDLSEYRVSVRPGLYELGYMNPRYFLPYRRACVHLSPESPRQVNLYPTPRTGVSQTVDGDVQLPDPVLAYDDYRPLATNPDLDLIVQYGRREESPADIRYGGAFMMVTFDQLTLRARSCVFSRDNMRITATEEFSSI